MAGGAGDEEHVADMSPAHALGALEPADPRDAVPSSIRTPLTGAT